jgi:hypothetical protein
MFHVEHSALGSVELYSVREAGEIELFQQIADPSTAPLAVKLREAPLRMAISGMAACGWIKPLYATLLRGLYVEPA